MNSSMEIRTPYRKEIIYLGEEQVEVYHVNEESKLGNVPYIFLHGWGLSPYSYLPTISEIAAHVGHVIAPTLPGFGKSTALKNPLKNNYSKIVEILQDTIDQLYDNSTPPIPLIGHSLGGGFAVSLAHRTPTRFSNLYLISPIGGSSANAVSWVKIISSLRHEINYDMMERLKDSLPSFLANPLPLAVLGIAARHTDLVQKLEEVSNRGIPIRLVLAANDSVVPSELYKPKENITIVNVDGTHGWLLKNPKLCAQTLFLD